MRLLLAKVEHVSRPVCVYHILTFEKTEGFQRRPARLVNFVILMKTKPLKRHIALQPLSRDHHHGLLLCWKIRKGLQHGVSPERVKAYADWFWEHHLHAHFIEEEKQIFPLLTTSNALVQQALNEHERLRQLFGHPTADASILNHTADDLEQHIRFEERVLFQEIQRVVSEVILSEININEDDSSSCPIWEDEFWK